MSYPGSKTLRQRAEKSSNFDLTVFSVIFIPLPMNQDYTLHMTDLDYFTLIPNIDKAKYLCGIISFLPSQHIHF